MRGGQPALPPGQLPPGMQAGPQGPTGGTGQYL
jgi:hypothetical protein